MPLPHYPSIVRETASSLSDIWYNFDRECDRRMATASPRFAHELIVKPVEFDEELRLANDLMAKTFDQDYYTSIRWFETCGAGYPGFRREHTRIALWKGELAGALRVNTETIRLGEARLKMGGIGWVSTVERHRHKGVCSDLMRDTLRYLREHGYHVSMLFGIPDFYHQFGYVTTLADYAVVVDSLEAPRFLVEAYRTRRVKPGDISAIQRIHAVNDSAVSCSLLRSAAHIKNKWDRFCDAHVLTNQEGKVLAYILARRVKDRFVVDEVGMESADLCQDVLRLCVKMAQREYATRIRFLVPPEHPFARFLTQCPSTHEMHVVQAAGGMMVFVDIGETLENMIPEWESLLSHSLLRDKRCEVTLVAGKAAHRIRANRGALDVAGVTGRNKLSIKEAELIRLLTGYTHLDEVLGAQRRLLAPDARELLTVLFPKRNPYVNIFDRF